MSPAGQGGVPVCAGITASTALCAIFGSPVGHSLSPVIHNAGFAAAGLDFAYLAFDVPDIAAGLVAARTLRMRGLSITIPHKETVLPLLDEVDPLAVSMGAVNTVVNDGGRLVGYNTDIDGVSGALEAWNIDCEGLQLVILGAGGAARAALFGALRRGRPDVIWIVARNAARGEALAAAAKAAAAVPVSVVADAQAVGLAGRAALIINATPVGMHPRIADTPLPAELLGPQQVVFDLVYNPLMTRLLREAAAAGAKVIGGDEMFMRQAFHQFVLWTGQAAPRHVMAEAFRQALAARQKAV
ncbi:MAG TPA: shikimate dehydrogenase [Spirochaetota bacterium]|nr:shikimate dehydrogenase [Spirochaetota bacterium]